MLRNICRSYYSCHQLIYVSPPQPLLAKCNSTLPGGKVLMVSHN